MTTLSCTGTATRHCRISVWRPTLNHPEIRSFFVSNNNITNAKRSPVRQKNVALPEGTCHESGRSYPRWTRKAKMPPARGAQKVLTCTWTPPPAGSWHILHCPVSAFRTANSPGASAGQRCNSRSTVPGFSLFLAAHIAAEGPTWSPALCSAVPGIGPEGKK